MAIGLKLSKLSLIDCTLAVKIFQDKKNNVAFIDVRDRKKYVQGFAFGAVNCPMDRFNSIISDLVPDKAAHLILIGTNTSIIRNINTMLKRHQFRKYHFIKGNYVAWKKANYLCGQVNLLLQKHLGNGLKLREILRICIPDN